MKTHRLLIIAITTVLLTAAPSKSSAADVTVDISSSAPLDPNAVLAQIELNVQLKQYEKVLTQIEDIKLEFALGNESISADATDEQKKQAKATQEKREGEYQHKMQALEDRLGNSHRRIRDIMKDASARAAETAKGTLMLSGHNAHSNGGENSLQATKDPQTGTLSLKGPLMLNGSNEYTNPTNVPASAPAPATK